MSQQGTLKTMPYTMPEGLSVNGRLSYENFKDFQQLHATNRLLFRTVYYLAVFTFAIMVASSFNTNLLRLFIPFGVVVCFLGALLTKVIAGFKYKSVYNSDSLLQKEYRYTFNHEGISMESEAGSSKFNWSDVYGVKRNKKMHAIYLAKNKALIFPRSFFESSRHIEEFEQILKRNLSVKQYKYRN